MAATQPAVVPSSGLPASALESWEKSNDNLPLFEAFVVPGHQDTASFGLAWSAPFPVGLRATRKLNLAQSVEAIRKFAESGELRRLAKQHGGAVLIRGLPVETPDDYSKVAHAFGFRPHVEVGRPPLRTVLAPNVKTANEGPPELPIWPHSEYGWSTINPAWLTFSALQLPASGGATPITSAIYIAHELSRLAPRFLAKLSDKGVRYVYRYTVDPLVSNTGTSVRGAYGQTVADDDDDEAAARRKIEAEVRRHSERFEWHDDGSLSVTHIVPAIRIHEATSATVFFGNVTSAWGRSRHHGATRPPFRGDDGSYHPPPTFGDGTQMDVEDLDLLLKLAEEGAVDVEWERGDVVLLDNYAVMHSRKPWKGQRQVLAALWDDDGRIRDFPEGLGILEKSPRVPRTEPDGSLAS
ncbi:Clavaminate synthase-like protein [Colletotrichum orbiculare MAFF 240422]|uniref:Clavaminate synthase-like protein n=1 Tax=Colletotrichum orbiculare (strain 104-T / ATCC 96160 / CBS 514.97 / LARS 414 / MAFF 240422) TaxID=1213857 RepID=N4V728_COLOR|nr:Clavaminate synthase-like protein [Colletotrichum orbiculare MAFF 240422]